MELNKTDAKDSYNISELRENSQPKQSYDPHLNMRSKAKNNMNEFINAEKKYLETLSKNERKKFQILKQRNNNIRSELNNIIFHIKHVLEKEQYS